VTVPISVYLVLGVVALFLALVAFHALCEWTWTGANQRANMLVRELLSPDELEQLRSNGYLTVPSRSTPGRVYRIPAQPGLVIVVDAGEPGIRLCLQPARSLPEPEHVLVHKLLLEGAEREYWQRANRLNVQRWPASDDAEVEIWTGPPPGLLSQR
jgi:hypothetical protein